MNSDHDEGRIVRQNCCSKKGMAIAVPLGIGLGGLIGLIFENTLTGMIIGFTLGMGIGGFIDARKDQ